MLPSISEKVLAWPLLWSHSILTHTAVAVSIEGICINVSLPLSIGNVLRTHIVSSHPGQILENTRYSLNNSETVIKTIHLVKLPGTSMGPGTCTWETCYVFSSKFLLYRWKSFTLWCSSLIVTSSSFYTFKFKYFHKEFLLQLCHHFYFNVENRFSSEKKSSKIGLQDELIQ